MLFFKNKIKELEQQIEFLKNDILELKTPYEFEVGEIVRIDEDKTWDGVIVSRKWIKTVAYHNPIGEHIYKRSNIYTVYDEKNKVTKEYSPDYNKIEALISL
jgi:hypothetical protein